MYYEMASGPGSGPVGRPQGRQQGCRGQESGFVPNRMVKRAPKSDFGGYSGVRQGSECPSEGSKHDFRGRKSDFRGRNRGSDPNRGPKRDFGPGIARRGAIWANFANND